MANAERDAWYGWLRDHFGENAALKVLLAVLFGSIGCFALSYRSIYPLSLTLNRGFLGQIPPVFWLIVVVAVGTGVVVSFVSSSKLITYVSVVLVSLVLNFKQYLFFSFIGGDSAGEIARWFVIRGLPRFSVELFEYFQWPMHFVFFQVLNKTISLPLVETLRISYLIQYLLFTTAVIYFSYVYAPKPSLWFVPVFVYLLYMRILLNNQFVPQLTALILLITLFGFGVMSTSRSRFVQLLLFLTLVLTHPFFFIFYLIFLILYPFSNSLRTQLLRSGDPKTPIYRSVGKILSRPHRALKSMIANGFREFVLKYQETVVLLSVVFVSFTLYRFVILRDRLYFLLARSSTGYGSSTILSDLYSVIYDDAGNSASEQSVRFLYYLTSQPVDRFATYTVIIVLLLLFVVTLVVFVRMPTVELSSAQIAVGLSGLTYYFSGFLLPILGTRGLQIGLLPLGVLAGARGTDPKLVKATVLVALVLSPAFGLNAVVNASIGAGGNSQNYHAHETGVHLVQYDLQNQVRVVKYSGSGIPLEFTDQQDQQIMTLDEMIREDVEPPSLIIFGPRQIHTASRYRRVCNFSPQTRSILFDNGIQVLGTSSMDGKLACVKRD